jgi:hypothetical protein
MSKIMIGLCVVGMVLASVATLGYCAFFGPPEIVWRGQIRRANHLITQVESYRNTHGRLPSAISEVPGETAVQDRTFYERCSDARYVVWFGTTLGHSMSYDSATRNWTPLNIPCQ